MRAIGRVDLHGAGEGAFAFSLLVAVTVIAHSAEGLAITDAGSKSFALDGPPPRVAQDGVPIGTIDGAATNSAAFCRHPACERCPSARGSNAPCRIATRP